MLPGKKSVELTSIITKYSVFLGIRFSNVLSEFRTRVPITGVKPVKSPIGVCFKVNSVFGGEVPGYDLTQRFDSK